MVEPPEFRYTLMLITDRHRSRLPLLELVRFAVDGGVNAVQVREKDLVLDDLQSLAARIVEAVEGKAWVVVNGRLDVAKELGIGVHLPESGPSVEEARAVLGDVAIIGRSVHSPEAATAVRSADYAIAGHVLPTKSKPRIKPLEMEKFKAITKVVSCPVFAIGGITAGSIRSMMKSGALGVAVIGAIAEADDPRAAAQELRTALDEWSNDGG